ncbi:hypothetical protein SAMN05660690_3578 [Geodermatophilus telluris]|uniref:Uncharacterized protein n=1 Tax=Geodermatophilus telluris TaxID=1190417 RepID=A0A1G6SH16_9ACTN|nr:hypothetical protein [Geodermatophilus telluris]SDD15395.1 hypothetical protein SAMN05660690_3578 [Geodermatophilus telluris]
MSDPVHRPPEHSGGADSPYADMSAAEKLACEWEARHDVAARGRRVDPAAALAHYLSHNRCAELHHEHPHPPAAARRRAAAEGFAAEHPLTASWVRWGEPD